MKKIATMEKDNAAESKNRMPEELNVEVKTKEAELKSVMPGKVVRVNAKSSEKASPGSGKLSTPILHDSLLDSNLIFSHRIFTHLSTPSLHQ